VTGAAVLDIHGQLAQLYAIGDGEVAGANRPGLSGAEQAAHDLMADWMQVAGLSVSRDRAGNLYGRLIGSQPDVAEVWSGSHLDTVPAGGRFDGALGVAAAVEALRRIGASGETLRRTLTAVAFRDEEGWRFGHGFFGSRALTGRLVPGTLDTPDVDGVTVRAALESLGLDIEEDTGPLVSFPDCFVEVHIEQGPTLAEAGAALGVVASIASIVEVDIRFDGTEGHAGTTPMRLRHDAGAAAARFHVALTGAASEIEGAVATIGRVSFEPGASNVIPGTSRLVVDARAPDDERRDQLAEIVTRAAESAASEGGCQATVTVVARTAATVMDARVRDAIQRAAPDAPALPSGAGHDAQILGAAGIPVGMLFVRSLAGGISHSPREHTSDEDVDAAVEALRGALVTLAA
jgi:allantoate deiminase